MRPRTTEKVKIEKKIKTLRIRVGESVGFTYYGKARRAKIKKVLRVNVEVLIVTGKGKRKTVRIPIKELVA